MAGAVIAISSIAQIGVLSADIVLQESDGSAYYPDIKRFADRLEVLNTEVEALKRPYQQVFHETNALKERMVTIAFNNEDIYVKLKRSHALAEEIRTKVDNLALSFPKKLDDVAQFSFHSTVLDRVVKYAAYGLSSAALVGEGVAFYRSFYSDETTLAAFRNRLHNEFHETSKTTSRLRLMKVSKIMTGMAVLGVAVAVYGLVRGLQGAKAKRDALEKAVTDAETTKRDLISETAKLNGIIADLSEDMTQSINAFQNSFQWMITDLDDAYDRLERENPGVHVDRTHPADLRTLVAAVESIRAKTLASTEQLDLMDQSQRRFVAHLDQVLAAFDEAKTEITVLGVIAPLARAGVALAVIKAAVSGLDPSLTEASILDIIHNRLNMAYRPPS